MTENIQNDMKEKIKSSYRSWVSSSWAFPAILFGVAFVAFGLLAPKLGFYMDDWPYIYYAYTRGISRIPEMLFYDSRPYAGWLYRLGFLAFGFKPLLWHLSTLFFRWLAAFGMWLFLNAVWAEKKRLANYAALLFIVYPYFLMQPLALGSTHHWVGFTLYFFSMFLMVKAETANKKSIFLILLALIFEGVHLFTAEYFSGLELLRPLVLFFLMAPQSVKISTKLWHIFKRWLPYLLVLSMYFYWRIVLFVGPPQGDRNRPELIYQFIQAPLKTAFSFLVTALQDSALILFQSWNAALAPSVFDLSSFFTRFVFFAILIGSAAIYTLLNSMDKMNNRLAIEEGRSNLLVKIFWLGFFATGLGALPLWIIGKEISTHTNQMAATRFGIPSMFGAAILFATLVLFFISDYKKQNMAIAILVALSVGIHLQNSQNYVRSWEKQKNLYYQIAERIPAVEENTAFIAAGEILFFMGEYPTAYAITTIYHSDEMDKEATPYWFASLYGSYYGRFDDFIAGMPLEKGHIFSEFHGNSKDILLLSFEPERNQCLWVLRPEDSDLPLISDLEQSVSQLSALNRIRINSNKEPLLPPDIFGTKTPQNWCIYYQRADLARQRGNWENVTSLWEDAQSNGKEPANGFEYIPFIEGYAYQSDWAQVKKLTRQSNKISQGMYHSLCPTLQNIEETTEASSERDAVITDLYDYLKCQ